MRFVLQSSLYERLLWFQGEQHKLPLVGFQHMTLRILGRCSVALTMQAIYQGSSAGWFKT